MIHHATANEAIKESGSLQQPEYVNPIPLHACKWRGTTIALQPTLCLSAGGFFILVQGYSVQRVLAARVQPAPTPINQCPFCECVTRGGAWELVVGSWELGVSS